MKLKSHFLVVKPAYSVRLEITISRRGRREPRASGGRRRRRVSQVTGGDGNGGAGEWPAVSRMAGGGSVVVTVLVVRPACHPNCRLKS
jgi:hypothetical protein